MYTVCLSMLEVGMEVWGLQFECTSFRPLHCRDPSFVYGSSIYRFPTGETLIIFQDLTHLKFLHRPNESSEFPHAYIGEPWILPWSGWRSVSTLTFGARNNINIIWWNYMRKCTWLCIILCLTKRVFCSPLSCWYFTEFILTRYGREKIELCAARYAGR